MMGGELILKRYEEMRQQCARYAGLHPESTVVCHIALGGVRHLPTISTQLAALCDDMALALKARPSTMLDAGKVLDFLRKTQTPVFDECDYERGAYEALRLVEQEINSGNLNAGEGL